MSVDKGRPAFAVADPKAPVQSAAMQVLLTAVIWTPRVLPRILESAKLDSLVSALKGGIVALSERAGWAKMYNR
jgi:hypothetical protein